MNLSRSLVAVPFVFIAAAVACSSSTSGNGTGTGSDGGGGSSGGGAECQMLSACCATLPASLGNTVTQCKAIAGGTNPSTCMSTLDTLTSNSYCGGMSSSSGTNASSSSGHSSSTATAPTSSNHSPSSSSSGSGNTSVTSMTATGPSCANPPSSPPHGFVPPVGIIGTGCSAAEVSAFSTCAVKPLSDADLYCNNPLIMGATMDGNYGPCGQCAFGTILQPGMNPPPKWGQNVIVAIEGHMGDPTSEWLLNFGPEIGVCVYAAGESQTAAVKTEAQKCGLDIMALDACAYTTCAGVCPIANPGMGSIDPTAEMNLNNCINTVVAGGCKQYQMAAHADCSANALRNTGHTGIYDKCLELALATYNEFGKPQLDAGGPTTAAGVAQLLELSCGGGDAGF